MDSHRLTLERTSLMHIPRASNSRSRCLNFMETDEAALRDHLIVVDFMVELSMVLPCTRCRAKSAITLFLSLWHLRIRAGTMSMS